MFDQQLKDQYKNLPKISMPDYLTGVSLLEHQEKGVKWLVKREITPSPPPFYKKVNENRQQLFLCKITNCAQVKSPALVHGSILCDEMGLGKSIQAICLILLAPPNGLQYNLRAATKESNKTTYIPKAYVPNKCCTLIVCPVSVLSNWMAQIEQYIVPGILNVQLYHGTHCGKVLKEISA